MQPKILINNEGYRTNHDDVSALLTVTLEKSDYKEKSREAVD